MQREIKFWTYKLLLLFHESCDFALAGQCENVNLNFWLQISVYLLSFFLKH
jgi:hypothetical protein